VLIKDHHQGYITWDEFERNQRVIADNAVSKGSAMVKGAVRSGEVLLAGLLRCGIRCWAAYITWRVERLAVARLGAMSDRQLRDLGIVRSQIEFAVKNGIGRGRVARPCL
jgi:uncharacterized protein YjiS (DUF1127 family)